VTALLPEGLDPLALRDACPCDECRHPVSGQRLFETTAIVPEARIAHVTVDTDVVAVDWADGHHSVFRREHAADGRPARTLWDASFAPVQVGYDDAVASPDALRRLLRAVAEYGFAVVTGAPREDGTVARVAELFGHVRETNYGRIFDVRVSVDPANLAFTSLPLSLHTDNPYRDPPPSLQLLHCLESDVDGGDTILADGFRAVSELQACAPEQVALLAGQPIRFAYRDETAELVTEAPVVELDTRGLPRAIRLNNRSKGVPTGSTALVHAWYEAYFAFVAVLEEGEITFRLDPGDVVLFDNLRVLHGRTGFESGGSRRLQGCYADRDALLSTLAVLERA